MLQALINVFKIAELRNKILFTVAMLGVFRLGHWIPLPGVNGEALQRAAGSFGEDRGAFGRAADFVAMMSGGALSHSTIFGLGVMPYITAGIIFQLVMSVSPRLKKLQEEGPTGRQKIQEWTRYATIALCFIQGFGWLQFLNAAPGSTGSLIYAEYAHNPMWWVMALLALTAGCMFLMWIGEQIDKYGIGNGVSLIITAGILARMPQALMWVVQNSPIRDIEWARSILNIQGSAGTPLLSWMGVMLLAAAFFFVVAGAVIMTVAQRRIPIQQAKHTRGRRVFGGQRSYLPLRVNHGGVMPVIFASSLMMIPSMAFSGLMGVTDNAPEWIRSTVKFLSDNLRMGEFPYVICEIILIYFFSYFWTTVQFNPEEMSKQLRDNGSFIPGLRPGPRTAEYLETVMERITYVGAGFLAIIAVLPATINKSLNIDWAVAQFIGGTGLLIVVSVGLDFIQRIEANLLMRNYAGFLGSDDRGGKGSRIRGPRG